MSGLAPYLKTFVSPTVNSANERTDILVIHYPGDRCPCPTCAPNETSEA